MSDLPLAEYLEHILEAAEMVLARVGGLSKAEFMADAWGQRAVVMNLVIIGEASAKLLQKHRDFADRHPDLPWQTLRGMRNHMVHGYFRIDYDVVWQTIEVDLPAAVRAMPRLLRQAAAQDPSF